jgi:hypothetical protein
MTQASQWLEEEDFETRAAQPSKHLSFLKFLVRYPIFLLAFGPPVIRATDKYAGFNTAQAHFDPWNVLQVGLLCLIGFRAIYRLAAAEKVFIPRQIHSVLKCSILLGLLFLISVAYSPGRVISTEYSILYFLNLACVVEFIVDVCRNPPNWIQCLFHLRTILFLAFAVVLLVLPFKPAFVMAVVPGAGIRLLGGSVASVGVICPIIAIISAYSFLHSFESRVRSTLFFLVGIVGLATTQVRGAELALFIVFAISAIRCARTSRRAAHIFLFGCLASILIAGVFVATGAGERIWNTFNRGQDTEGILSASGRTSVWTWLIQQSLTHPQGMGYIAGIRATVRPEYETNLHLSLTYVGGTDNSYMETLADAGWLALALYLIMLAKTAALGWRFAGRRALEMPVPDRAARHAIRCSLLLFLFCLVTEMEGSTFVLPLRQEFYIQNIVIAIILGTSARMLIVSRTRYQTAPPKSIQERN